MKILIINGYQQDSKTGRNNYHYFFNTIKELFAENEITDNHYVERECNELNDYIVDWEHEQLGFNAELNCERFDELDFIFIGGDMCVLPWEPRSTQLTTLIHMCKYTFKPCVGIGYGAFCIVYALATKGKKYHILNGPLGAKIDSLPEFPFYSASSTSAAFPSGWLDHETGDIYSYDRLRRGWWPVCNVGIHFVSTAGREVSKDIHSPNRHEPSVVSSNLTSNGGAFHEAEEDKIRVTNLFLRSPLIVNQSIIPLSKHFSTRLYHNWYLNRNGTLPGGENLLIIAEGKCGPNILLKDRMLILTSRLEPYINVKYLKAIISNFIMEMNKLLLTNENGKIDYSLFNFLFERKPINYMMATANTLKTAGNSASACPSSSPREHVMKLVSRGGNLKSRPPTSIDKFSTLLVGSASPSDVISPRSGKGGTKETIAPVDRGYDTSLDRTLPTPLSKQFIPSLLRDGPMKIDQPMFEMFYKPVKSKQGEIDIYALTANRKSSSVGRRPRQIIQNPLGSRKKRLELVFQQIGIKANEEAIEKGLQVGMLENPEEMTSINQSEIHQDLLAGLTMNENSITTRRHHLVFPGEAGSLIAPSSSYDATSGIDGNRKVLTEETSQLSDGKVIRNQVLESIYPRSPSVFVPRATSGDDSMSMDPLQVAAALKSSAKSNSNSPRVLSPSSKPATSVSFKEAPNPEDSDDEEEKDDFSLVDRKKFDEKQKSLKVTVPSSSDGKKKVPLIADWIKVFEKQQEDSLMSKLIEESNHLPRTSQTERVSSTRSSNPPRVTAPLVSSSSAREKSSSLQFDERITIKPFSADSTEGIQIQTARSHFSSSTTTTTSTLAGKTQQPNNDPKRPSQTLKRSMKSQTPRTLRTMNTCKNVTSILTAAKNDYYLPVKHPKTIEKVAKEYLIDNSFISDLEKNGPHIEDNTEHYYSPLDCYEEVKVGDGLSSEESSVVDSQTRFEERRHDIISNNPVVFLKNKAIPSSQHSNYLKKMKEFTTQDENQKQANYQGLYSEPYQSFHEREIKEYNKAKERFVAGNFQTSCKHDTLQLRKEGLIRPFSEYPKFPGAGYETLTAADWNLVKRDNKEEFISGAWKK
jgi:hypothetical protein